MVWVRKVRGMLVNMGCGCRGSRRMVTECSCALVLNSGKFNVSWYQEGQGLWHSDWLEEIMKHMYQLQPPGLPLLLY